MNANPANPVIGVRSFGPDPDLVARHTAAYVAGVQGAGVAACAKHFPGHGDTTTDSHLALPTVHASRDLLAERDLPPFRAAVEAGVRSIMCGHLLVPALDPDLPATLSRAALTELLRGELGFDGMLVTDAIEMRAVAAMLEPGEITVRALAARRRRRLRQPRHRGRPVRATRRHRRGRPLRRAARGTPRRGRRPRPRRLRLVRRPGRAPRPGTRRTGRPRRPRSRPRRPHRHRRRPAHRPAARGRGQHPSQPGRRPGQPDRRHRRPGRRAARHPPRPAGARRRAPAPRHRPRRPRRARRRPPRLGA
ncbi:glycoside hydrolase family 3 N-terminal domain-containing protein [Nonomuraea ferruginea]